MRRRIFLAFVPLVLLASSALAQMPFGGKRGQSLRLAGIIEPESCEALCLGTLKLQVAKRVRRLGVTMAQTENDEGMFIFRGFELQSGQPLRLLGPKPMLKPFLDAPPGTPVRMWGLFQNLTFVVAELTVDTPTRVTPLPTP